MKPTSQSTINDLLAALNELHALVDTRKAELDELVRKLGAVQETLDFFSGGGTVQIHAADAGTGNETGAVADVSPRDRTAGLLKLLSMQEWRRELEGLNQFESLMRIAQLNGGNVRPTEAAGILIAIGRGTGNRRNLGNGLYALVSRSESFEKVAPGTFRLVTPQSTQAVGNLWQERNGTHSALPEAQEGEVTA